MSANSILARLWVPLFLIVLFLLLVPVAYFASRNHEAWPGIIILWPLGTTLGIGILIAGRSAARDAEKVERAVAGGAQDIPRDGETATIVGTLRAFGETLRSPFSRTDSVFYYYDAGHFEETRNLAKRSPSDPDYATVLKPDYEGYGVS